MSEGLKVRQISAFFWNAHNGTGENTFLQRKMGCHGFECPFYHEGKRTEGRINIGSNEESLVIENCDAGGRGKNVIISHEWIRSAECQTDDTSVES